MKKILLLFLSGLAGIKSLQAQTPEWLLGRGFDYVTDVASIKHTRLFDLAEIKNRNYETCYIISPITDAQSNLLRKDTLYIFTFDTLGRIARKIFIASWDKKIRDTTYFFPFNKNERLILTTSLPEGKNMYKTDHILWAFIPETTAYDTALIRISVYDERGRILEEEQHTTADYANIYFCGTGLFFHNKYGYDKKDRIIYYEDIYAREYVNIKYTRWGRMIRVYDNKTGRFKRKNVVVVQNHTSNISESTDEEKITLTRISNGSKLFSRLAWKQRGTNNTKHYYLFYAPFKTAADNRPQSMLLTQYLKDLKCPTIIHPLQNAKLQTFNP